MLHCTVLDSGLKAPLSVKWERDDGGLDSRIHQLANGTLFFPHLKEEDFGNYSCSAKRGNKQIQTTVMVSKACLDDVFFHPQSMRTEEGHDVFLQCVSGDSSPPAQISWLKNGRILTKGNQIQGQYGGGSQRKTSGTLHMANITKADQGVYICITHNHLLNISKGSKAATLTVHDSNVDVKIIEGPQNVTVPVEMESAMHCFVEGFPFPTIQWFKDGNSLPNSSRWDLQKDGQLLIFQRVLSEDEGLYFCEARNERQKVISEPAYLLPAVMDWSFVLEPANLTVKKGEAATLSCRPPHSRPQAQVSWFKNNSLLQTGLHYTFDYNGDLVFHREKEKSQTWLPVIEKHDIPIVVGVGVSLAFIFIAMAFYSLVQKNDPAAVPTGRAALRGICGRHGEHLAMERTYDNKAFEDDNLMAVIEQSPNTLETRALPTEASPSILMMEPPSDDLQECVQSTQGLPVIVETHPEPREEDQLETIFEEGKVTPSPHSDIQLQCMEDWRSREFEPGQDAPSPPPANPPPAQEEGLRSSLTLQTSDPSSTPVRHSINISHGFSPLLLSHCVSLGMTSVAVDVHFYPSGPSAASRPPCPAYGPPGQQVNTRLEHELTTPSASHSK
ncbi:hypothetical protein cypCar_00026975 [Cyprinus carpio]|nr:hypothetical protein cypCar_00026975 [Cyprinus carpio]